MNRFFLPDEVGPGPLPAGCAVSFAPEDASHIARVLRLVPGDEVIGTAHGWEYLVRLTATSAAAVRGEVIKARPGRSGPPLRLLVAQGLPKGDRMEWVIQKATELGAAGILPVACRRSVVQLRENKAEERRQRWAKVAREAAQQCHRTAIPAVLPVTAWADAVQFGGRGTLRLVLWEGESVRGLKEVLREGGPAQARAGRGGGVRNGGEPAWDVIVYVGPEGGLDAAEVEQAAAAGAVPVSLGPRILRTETAALTAVSLILYEWADLGLRPAQSAAVW